jgi:N-acetylmuramoyl-L-alanine amidase-like protein
MAYPFVPAANDYGPRKGPVLAFLVHMAEGGGTVGYLSNDPQRGVSVHYVIEYTGRIVQMLSEDHASGSVNPKEIRLDDDPDGFYGRSTAVAVCGTWANDPNSVVISVEIEGFAMVGPNAAEHASLTYLVRDVRSRFSDIGLLGHRDFAAYKACPGKLIHWDLLGGHGTLMTDIDIKSDPALVDVPAGISILNPDGSKRLTNPDLRTDVVSPGTSLSAGGTVMRLLVWSEPDPTPDLLLAAYGSKVTNVRRATVVDCDDVVKVELDKAATRAAEAVKAR